MLMPAGCLAFMLSACYAPADKAGTTVEVVPMDEAEAAFLSSERIIAAVAEETAALQAAEFARERRKEAGLSQAELARRAGVTQARISKLETGDGPQGPTLEVLSRIARACGGELVLLFRRTA